jgi:hypothetical protein
VRTYKTICYMLYIGSYYNILSPTTVIFNNIYFTGLPVLQVKNDLLQTAHKPHSKFKTLRLKSLPSSVPFCYNAAINTPIQQRAAICVLSFFFLSSFFLIHLFCCFSDFPFSFAILSSFILSTSRSSSFNS